MAWKCFETLLLAGHLHAGASTVNRDSLVDIPTYGEVRLRMVPNWLLTGLARGRNLRGGNFVLQVVSGVRYMKPVEIMEDLFFIQRGYLNGNHFVYRNERPIVIDTAYIADFDVTEGAIKSLGIDLGQTELIVNTHCHCDHIGGNKINRDSTRDKTAQRYAAWY